MPASQRLLPSMFHRRLLLLVATSGFIVILLVTQLTRLTVAQADVWRQKAESTLERRQLIPTVRGRILDRRMRVLATDRPSYNVCVRYPVLSGDWAYSRARRIAYRENRTHWDQLREDEQEAIITGHQAAYNAQVNQLWEVLSEVGAISPEDLHRKRRQVIEKVELIATDVWLRRLEQRRAELDEPVSLSDVAQPIGEQQAAHPLLENVHRNAIIQIQRRIAVEADDKHDSVWSQVSIEPDKMRDYPMETMTLMIDRENLPGPLHEESSIEVTVEGVGTHLLGTLRGVWREDAQHRPYRSTGANDETVIDLGGYLPGDRIGRWGIERSQEDHLRGTRGQVTKRLDSSHERRLEPVPGQDTVLTVDIQLQARIQGIMDPDFGLMRVHSWHASHPPQDPTHPQIGDPLNGAAVVLDVAQGHVLAAVSVPTFSLRQLRENPKEIWDDTLNQPFQYRPVAQPYQPGSTVKPLVLAAAITNHDLGHDETIVCNGHLDPQSKTRYRCWIYKMYDSTHGPLNGSEAIARSCNIFFYTLGRRMGPQRLTRWYDRLGLGKTTDCGLIEEVGGDLPDLSRADDPNTPGFTAADAIFMGIGQGPVRWTPLQAANCYATLARGGYMIRPTFIMVGKQPQERSGTDLHLDPRAVELAMHGLDEVINQPYGTANHISGLDGEPIFNIKGVRLYGKSGTAQAVSQWSDDDGDGLFTRGVDRIVRRGDHAWTICLVQRPGSPCADYVVAVVVEYGGSGGTVAGPIVNQILHAMRAEGYL